VDLFEKRMLSDVPVVLSDHKAVAHLAADHLMSLALWQFAFCGFPGLEFSEQRGKHFCQYIAAHGHDVRTFKKRDRARSRRLTVIEAKAHYQAAELAAWLRKLPKPVGIMACNDIRAYGLLSACEQSGIRVPDDVMVIGVDNDPIWCELSGLSLSSVAPNAERVGYEAAALLERMIVRRRRVPHTTLVAPRGVVVRQSTSGLAIPNQEMAHVLKYVREHACEGLTVKSLCQRTATARSTLCHWFMEYLGRSPGEEITRVRIDHIKCLLSTTNMRLEEISRRCGFAHVETLYRLFKRITGKTPRDYRNQWMTTPELGNETVTSRFSTDARQEGEAI
jgi:LacI family transcriptional regulator